MYYKKHKISKHKTRKRHYGGRVSPIIAEQIAKKRFNLIANAKKAANHSAAIMRNITQKRQAILNRHQQEYEAIIQKEIQNKNTYLSMLNNQGNNATIRSELQGIKNTASLKKKEANQQRNAALKALEDNIVQQEITANASMNKMALRANVASRNHLFMNHTSNKNRTLKSSKSLPQLFHKGVPITHVNLSNDL